MLLLGEASHTTSNTGISRIISTDNAPKQPQPAQVHDEVARAFFLSERDMQGGRCRARPWTNGRRYRACLTQHLVDSLNTWAKANTREDRKRDNKRDKCCEPTHPPRDPDGKFLKFCELTQQIS